MPLTGSTSQCLTSLLSLTILTFTLTLFPRPTSALWPIPRNLSTGTTIVKLSPTFTIEVQGMPSGAAVPQDLQDAIDRTKVHLKNDKLERLIVGRGQSDASKLGGAGAIEKLVLLLNPSSSSAVGTIMQEATKDIAARVEAYSLNLPSTNGGTATINATTSLGLFRGLTTFEQLWYVDPTRSTVYAWQAPVRISNDSPAYPYRGFMLDTARNYFPVTDIKRTLDAMSMVKMSQFHWHVVDSQSFPLVVPGFTEISEKGAYSASEVYTQQDVQDIVNYAGARGIDVLMEIDTPGHTAIISQSHPEHIACPQSTPWESFANEPPAGQLRLASASTTNFTAALLSAAAKNLPSTLFSTGGDELNVNCYSNDKSTQDDLRSTGRSLEQALNVFTQASHSALSVGQDASRLGGVWISSQNAAAVAAKGLRLVHAPSDYFYLDCGAGEWITGDPTGTSWCDPFKTWQKAYTFNPLSSLSSAQAKLVLGGEQLLWAEQSSPENLDSIVWPRAAASAEVFWTGSRLPDGSAPNVRSALPRLHDIRYRMVQRGIKAIALQPRWCALREGLCNFD